MSFYFNLGIHFMHKSTGPPTHYTYRSCSAIKTHTTKLLVHSFCAVNVRGGLELCSYTVSRALATCTQNARQTCSVALRGLTLLTHLRFAVIPLTVDRGGKKATDLFVRVASPYRTTLKFSELFRTTHSFTNVCKGRLHG